MPFGISAKVDSIYIKPYDQKLSIRVYQGKSFIFLTHETEDEELSFQPNNPLAIGVGFSLKNFFFGLNYAYGFDFMRDKEYGKTKAFDFQFHNYGRQYAIDLFIQKYKGFYSDEEELLLFPDLSITQYGLYGQYVFNHKKFSYKAAFDQSEVQLKSAGSWLIGTGVYLNNINTGTELLFGEKTDNNNFQFGISAGYAFNWVINRYWLVSLSVTTGIHFGSEKINTFGKQALEVYPTVFPRFAANYHRPDWSIGLSFLSNFIFPSFSEDSNTGLSSGNFQVTFVKRFDLIPFIDKK